MGQHPGEKKVAETKALQPYTDKEISEDKGRRTCVCRHTLSFSLLTFLPTELFPLMLEKRQNLQTMDI